MQSCKLSRDVFTVALKDDIIAFTGNSILYTMFCGGISRPPGVWLYKNVCAHRTCKSAKEIIIIILGRVLHRKIPDQLGAFNIKG